jgi:putative heme-binding domain-containing protein
MRNVFYSKNSTVKYFYLLLFFVLTFLTYSYYAVLFPSHQFFQSNSSSLTSELVSAKADEIPAVQVLVPGFSVKEIPLTLTNINTVRYGTDGRLYALAYDGRIYVLTDTDGDGIEDKAEYWWDKNPLVSPVSMVVAKEGIYVTSLNKLSLLKDVSKSGKADTEEIITSNWEKPAVYTGTTANGVDAFGIAQDKAGNIYFALGAKDFTKAYMVDSLGKTRYDLKSERGTILKVSPGSSKREILVTGTRFPVSMAFNQEGDLFATDQEGATWLPNGNPYDELIHIQEGRHYGFPPRHPEHLPNVIDEPSVYDYKPQHQSTTGIYFNMPVNKGPVFGPEWWGNDAIVTGYSRGKIYRTKLVKTPAGYVAQNSIIASLTSLTVDACVSPKGDLVVATHSGPPDWGFGPQAEGKLYKIFYTNPAEPNPISVWASKPDQVSIAFDKPVKKDYLVNLADKIEIKYGEYVEAGDQFEVVRPGYKAVERQINFHKDFLKVKNVDLSSDGKTLILNTFTHTAPATYAITLPAFSPTKNVSGILQNPTIDLSYKLHGVQVSWQANSGEEKWEGVIPHLDLAVSKALLSPSNDKEAIERVLRKRGKVTFKANLNLWNMLRPDIQPGLTINYKLPPEDVHFVFKSSEPLEIKADTKTVLKSVKKGRYYETKLTFSQVAERGYPLEVSMNTSLKEPLLELIYATNEDPRPRALQTHRFFLPWLNEIYSKEISHVKEIPELAGGNWSRGKDLFFGESTCSNCHSIGGKGKYIGPDLSNLVFRNYTSVLRDIREPSATINPDYLAHTVTLKNDQQLTGMISYKKDSLVLRNIVGKITSVSLQEVKSTTPLSVSLMPQGLDKMLGEEKMKDLMTYLLTYLQPAEIKYPFLPPMKNTSEVNAVIRNSNAATSKGIAKASKLLKILWVSGPKDHGPDEHDYPLQQERWTQLLSLADEVEISKATQWPSQDQFNKADVIVFYWNYPSFNEEHGKQLDEFLKKGGGLVYLHYAVDATENPNALAKRIGLAWKGGHSKFRHGRVELDFTDQNHPITQGFTSAVFQDETYWQLIGESAKMNVLATATEEGKSQPIFWTKTEGKGRVFVSILGHYNWTFDDPLFRILLLRGISWTGNQSIDRFNDIATMGARVSK